jgi:hypothetical protein
MKLIRFLLPILATLAGFPALHAQTIGGGPDAGNGAPPPSNANLPRMSTAFSHKPNATPPPSDLAIPIAKFFNGLKSGDYANTYETFMSGSPLGQQKEKMSAFISRTEEAFTIYGPLYDYELFDNYSIGNNVIVLTYLTRHQNQPLRWRFIFYRPEKSWRIINMGFDDVLLDMLN